MKHPYSDRELEAMGYLRARDGSAIDNRDEFFSDHPNDCLSCYDTRTHVAVPRDLLAAVLRSILDEPRGEEQ